MSKAKKLITLKVENWDWLLFMSIFLYILLPTIYRSYSIYLIGNRMPSANNLAIVSQWQFVQVTIEIIQEAIVLPLFFFIGSKIKEDKIEILQRVKTSLVIITIIVLIITSILFFNIDKFVKLIGTNSTIFYETSKYLKIRIWSVLFNILSVGIIIVIESLNKKRILFLLAIGKVIFSLLFDSLFFGGYTFSLNLGVSGVAISNLMVDLIIFIIAFRLLLRTINAKFIEFIRLPLFKDVKLFVNIGLGSGADSLVRNIAYTFMIIKMLNVLGPNQIGGYYLTMHIFWGFALIPVLSIAETCKALISNNYNSKISVLNILKSGLIITFLIVLLWLIMAVFIKPIFIFFNKNNDLLYFANKSFWLLFIPYILFAFNTVIDSLFYGVGKTKYMAYQSLWTNGLVYLSAFVLFSLNFWNPTFTSIMIVFGLGILVDSIFTIYYARLVLNKIIKNQAV